MDQWRPGPPTNSGEAESKVGSKFGVLRVRFTALVEHFVRLLRWFGWGRIITLSLCVPLVGVGGFFLLRTPQTPVENSLAFATTMPSTAKISETSIPPPFSAVSKSMTVHVAGSVVRPGVYVVPAGSRVVDAIRFSGGGSLIADLDAINLAGPLVDGQQVYIPAVGEKPPGGDSGTANIGGGATISSSTPRYPININTSDSATLDALPGIGPATAQAIVAYRDRNGPFASIEALEEVPGIGPAKIAALNGLITV